VTGREATAICYDKLRPYTFYRRNGLHTPETIGSLDIAHEWLSSGRIRSRHVKPRCGFGSANTFVANNPSHLDAFFSYAKGMIVQQYLEVEVTL